MIWLAANRRSARSAGFARSPASVGRVQSTTTSLRPCRARFSRPASESEVT